VAAPDLSLTDWCVLALVAETPRHGFAVARELGPGSELGRVWTVARPLVYRSLDSLAGAGLTEAVRTEEGERGPTRVVFRASRVGRTRLQRWLARPIDHPRDVRVELLVKFVLSVRSGRPCTPLARAQQEQFVTVAAGLVRAARAAEGSDRIVARWRLESIRAVDRMLMAVIADEARAR